MALPSKLHMARADYEAEVSAYNAIRAKLLEMAETYPAILQIPIADESRQCPACLMFDVRELPGEHFRCRECLYEWNTLNILKV